jgi:hypothetical protein
MADQEGPSVGLGTVPVVPQRSELERNGITIESGKWIEKSKVRIVQ